MEIKTLCDRCFKDVSDEKILHKYGSAVYCDRCYQQIETELLEDMKNIYLRSQKVC